MGSLKMLNPRECCSNIFACRSLSLPTLINITGKNEQSRVTLLAKLYPTYLNTSGEKLPRLLITP